MFKNYLKIAWRNLLRRRLYTAINIIGLSLGVTFVFLTVGYIWSELQVNRNFKRADRIFLLQSEYLSSVKVDAAPSPFARALKEAYPELVSDYYRSFWKSTIISNGEKHFRDNVQIGDTTLINMFGLPLLYGNIKTLFDNPEAVVITAQRALKFFGTTDILGKTLSIQNSKGDHQDFVVTGVLSDFSAGSFNTVRANATIPANCVFLSINGVKKFYEGDDFSNWEYNRNSYVLLKEGVTPADLVRPIRQLIASRVPAESRDGLNITLRPLTTFHLEENDGIVSKIIFTLSLTALFILVMAIVNFVNMSIAGSMSRLKEIGLRKVMGGLRLQLIFQFLIEATIVSFIAIVLSLFTYWFANPYATNILGKELIQFSSMPLSFIAIPIALILFIGLLAGIYPALVLSSVNTVESVKGKMKGVKENILLRRTLVVFQFFIAIVVFISAVVVSRQVNFFVNTDLGFNKEQVLNLELPREWTADGIRRIETIRDEIAVTRGVMATSISYSIPNRNTSGSPALYEIGKDPSDAVTPHAIISDENYAKTFSIPVIAGSFFGEAGGRYDSSTIVVNEAFINAFGWNSGSEAVGKKLITGNRDEGNTICGVVKNFHFESKHETIKPLVFYSVADSKIFRFMSLNVESSDMVQTIASIEKKWKKLLPGSPFDFSFMDETINIVYKSELQLKKASYFATIMALTIVMLGIIGMVSLSVAKRSREIGIRKVLGSSVFGIIIFFIKDFAGVIIVANLIAWPVAYLMLDQWLNDYAYRSVVGMYPFVMVSVFLVLFIMMLIGLQTLKAATRNPAHVLRGE